MRETDELAAHLSRSLAVHASANRRSMSAAPAEMASSQSSGLHVNANAEDDKGKAKSRSHSIGFFGSRKARSKSRVPVGRGSAAHTSDLVQVDEEGERGRRGPADRPPLEHSGSSGGVVVTPGSEGDGGWETEPNQDGLELQKGVHGFEFAFIIPCDAPPYERSPYGRVRYIIKATAIGAGRAKSNVECWRDLYPMVNPSPDSGPTPLTVLYNDMHPTVGLVSIACTSNNISVGGVFNIDVNSPNPPKDLIVYLVRVSLETTIELSTKRKGKQTVPVQRHKLFEKAGCRPRTMTDRTATVRRRMASCGTRAQRMPGPCRASRACRTTTTFALRPWLPPRQASASATLLSSRSCTAASRLEVRRQRQKRRPRRGGSRCSRFDNLCWCRRVAAPTMR